MALDEYGDTYHSNTHSGAETFATASNVEESASYLQSCLSSIGLSYNLNVLSGSREDAAELCNCMYDLLQRHYDATALKDKYQADQRSLRFDLQSSDKLVARMKAQLESKQQEIGDLCIKLHQQEARHKEEMQMLDQAGAELARKVQQLEQRQVQAQHELKRKDVEYERLQGRLRGAVAGGRGAAGALESPAAPASANKLRPSRSAREQEELHKRVVEAFETKTRELEQQNEQLRTAVAKLQEEHQLALEQLHHLRQLRQLTRGDADSVLGSPTGSRRRRWDGSPPEQLPSPLHPLAAPSPPAELRPTTIIYSPQASPRSQAAASSFGSLSDAECGAVVVPEPPSSRPKSASKSLLFDDISEPGGGGAARSLAAIDSVRRAEFGSSRWRSEAAAVDGDLDPGVPRQLRSPRAAAGADPAAVGLGSVLEEYTAGPAAGQLPTVGDLRARMHEIKLKCKRQLSLGAGGPAVAASAARADSTAEERELQRELGEAQSLIQEQDRVLKMMLHRMNSSTGQS